MSLIHGFERLGEGLFSMFFKLMVLMIAFAFGMALVVILAVYWPFTAGLFIGLLGCELFYKQLENIINVKFPEYFHINVSDFFATFTEHDEDVKAVELELQDKNDKAERMVMEMKDASQSASEQLEKVRVRGNLKTLFRSHPADISPRYAKSLEMQLGKPKWATHIEKESEKRQEWNDLLA